MKRRRLLACASAALFGVMPVWRSRSARVAAKTMSPPTETPDGAAREVTLFLCGDVMTGRGVDQILPHPSSPELFEPYMRSAVGYVELAERASGPIPKPVDFAYVWGDALAELERMRPDARIVNLETSVTASNDAWPHKGIHYRMHPANVPCLTTARLDCCVLANNHVLDWGRSGLAETLDVLRHAGLRTAGAGCDEVEAAAPAIIELAGNRRMLVFAFCTESSGVPPAWAATRDQSGVNLLKDLSRDSVEAIGREVQAHKRAGDIAVLSLHWGGNWGYEISAREQEFARRLIDTASVDVVHGHSSHHPKGIEVHRDKLILYGCGDFLTDYEGISGHEAYRGDLGLMYFATLDVDNGRLLRVAMTPTRMQKLRVNRATADEACWVLQTLNRESKGLGTRIEQRTDGGFQLHWD
jgi:poly-gamma-glutamate synthesis protein (capsule biosynthesis protein)